MYIHDYLVKRDMKATAQAFQAEGKVSSEPVGECFWMFFFFICLVQYGVVLYHLLMLILIFELWVTAIDAPGGFLFEWWSVFWDIFIARTNEKHSDVAASYIEVCYKIAVLSY